MDAAALLITSSLLAQSQAPDDASAAPFRLEAALDLWLPRLEGDFTDSGAEIDVRTTDLHDSETAPAGSLTLSRGALAVELRGFSFTTEGRGAATEAYALGGMPVSAGDVVDSAFSWWSAGAEVRYDVLERHRGAANGTDFTLFALGSLDVQSVTRDLANETTDALTRAKEAFFVAELGGGFRLAFDTKDRLPLLTRVEILAKAGVGLSIPMGDGEFGGATRIEAQFTGWLGEQTAVYLGYRLVGASLTGEDMEMTASLQGLRAGFRHEF